MKQLIFSLLSSFLFFSSTYADCFFTNNPLIDITIGQIPLTVENIAKREEIHAYQIDVEPFEYEHIAYYNRGHIITHLKDFGNDWGKQFVYLHDREINKACGSYSISTSWRIEKIKGKKYIIHQHNGFSVYTSKDNQFVVGNCGWGGN